MLPVNKQQQPFPAKIDWGKFSQLGRNIFARLCKKMNMRADKGETSAFTFPSEEGRKERRDGGAADRPIAHLLFTLLSFLSRRRQFSQKALHRFRSLSPAIQDPFLRPAAPPIESGIRSEQTLQGTEAVRHARPAGRPSS